MQDIVTIFTKDIEYIALSEASREAITCSQFLNELSIFYNPLHLFSDNTSALIIAHNLMYYYKTKYINIKYYYIYHIILKNKITANHISKTEQLADILTKKLNFFAHLSALQNISFLLHQQIKQVHI